MKDTLKNGLTKEVNVFQKSVPLAAIFLVAMVATGSAALLATYGTVTGTADVEQSILLDGEDHTGSVHYGFSDRDQVAGSTDISLHDLKNQADVDADIVLNTSCEPDEADDCDGIDSSYTVFEDDHLVEQDQAWGDATANVVVDDETENLAVHAQTSVNEDDYDENADEAGSVSAGTLFGLSGDHTFDGDNTVSVDYRIGDDHHETRDAPDWIAYIVTATDDVAVEDEELSEGDRAVVIDATVSGDDETVDFQMGGDEIVFPYDSDYAYEDIRSGDLMDKAEIEQVKVATGTDTAYGSGTVSDLYYFDVRFEGTSLFPHYEPEDSLTLDAGTTADLAIKTTFDVALQPDDYFLSTTVSPDTEDN